VLLPSRLGTVGPQPAVPGVAGSPSHAGVFLPGSAFATRRGAAVCTGIV